MDNKEGKIYSATGDGKIPWISADDIAAVTFVALTSPQAPNTEYLVLGPELLSYGDVSRLFVACSPQKIYSELATMALTRFGSLPIR